MRRMRVDFFLGMLQDRLFIIRVSRNKRQRSRIKSEGQNGSPLPSSFCIPHFQVFLPYISGLNSAYCSAPSSFNGISECESLASLDLPKVPPA